jgi:hypothetical protein
MEKLKKILSKIGSYIPGYNGYANRSERRNSDGKLRNILLILKENVNYWLKLLGEMDTTIMRMGF